MSFTPNKNLNPLLSLLINCLPVRSTPQVLPIKGVCAFIFLDYLIIGVINFG